MKHRFPTGTQYLSRGRRPHPCTAIDQLTVRNAAGAVVSIRYTTQHEFPGQKVGNHNGGGGAVIDSIRQVVIAANRRPG